MKNFWKTFMPWSALTAWIALLGAAALNLPVAIVALAVFGVMILLVMSLWEVNNSPKLTKQNKLIWTIGLLPGNMFFMPLYFLTLRKKLLTP